MQREMLYISTKAHPSRYVHMYVYTCKNTELCMYVEHIYLFSSEMESRQTEKHTNKRWIGRQTDTQTDRWDGQTDNQD